MAAKAEVLIRNSAATHSTTDKDRPSVTRRFGIALAAWARRGQLGSSNYTELGRYTGGRI